MKTHFNANDRQARYTFRRLVFTAACGATFLTAVGLPQPQTWVVLGPETFTRTPTPVTQSFSIRNPNTKYSLRIGNGGANAKGPLANSAGGIKLNGALVAQWNQTMSEMEKAVTLLPNNQLEVAVTSGAGTGMTMEIVGLDTDPPKISATMNPLPNAAGWNNSDVTVTFACSDVASGVGFCPSPITFTMQGANQVVTGTAFDKAGNSATASVTINLDKTLPAISASINPPSDASGSTTSPATVTFTCADALSGVASCAPPVTLSQQGTGQVVTGTATDVAGNTATTSVTVNISGSLSSGSFYIRNYAGKCLDYGVSPSGNGATVFLNDCPPPLGTGSANAIRVVELPSRKGNGITLIHEIMLFAGNNALGIHNPLANTAGGSLAPASATTQGKFALELQVPWNSPHATAFSSSPANQIFAYDGDSIILESSRPCVNTVASTTLCLSPPQQIVIQVQNSRGVNGSPLVAAVRNLSDNEFWDFVPLPGSPPYPTNGFQSVASPDALWNALCASPQVKPGIYPPLISDLGQSDDGQPLSACSTFIQGWGAVILIASPVDCNPVPGPLPGQTQDIGGCIDLSGYPTIILPAGVTLRGNRRGTNFGPQLYFSFLEWHNLSTNLSRPGNCKDPCMLEVQGDYVRVTGLRLRGGSRSTDYPQPGGIAIQVDFPGSPNGPLPFSPTTLTNFIATIDHNDVSDWPTTGIAAHSPFDITHQGSPASCNYPGYFDINGNTTYTCGPENPGGVNNPGVPDPSNPNGPRMPIDDDPSTLANVHVARNFIHHNQENNLGYGAGGRAFIDGNVFDWNRHAIASDGEPHQEYRAAYNLVLSSSSFSDQDFDMHGTNNGYSGTGGSYVDIFANTFLATNRSNYWLRGFPSFKTDFHRNISLRSEGDAVVLHLCYGVCTGFNVSLNDLINVSADNQFGVSDPTTRFGPASLGVGDFDGDGGDDLFLATGAAWYYSPGGAREWRFLNAAPDTVDKLLFGDFDGDGRTDVVALHGGQLLISWGGISDWDVLNATPCTNTIPITCPTSVADLAVGDFDGDGKPDIFWADGTNWYVSSGGTGPFNVVNASSFHVSDLRFGHFAICGAGAEADVFSVQSSGWSVSCGAATLWQPLPVSLACTVNGPACPVNSVFLGDFNGDGNAEIETYNCNGSSSWCVWFQGSPGWQYFNLGGVGPSVAGVGHFLGRVDANLHPLPADLLLWSGNELYISRGGTTSAIAYSSQEMK